VEEKIKKVKDVYYVFFEGKWVGSFPTIVGAAQWLEDRENALHDRCTDKTLQSSASKESCGKSCPCD
jgi:hypothetical protein